MAEQKITLGMKFRRALLQISKQLDESDVEQMKFLVAGLPDKPGHADVETAKSAMAFFMLLVKNEDISETKYYLLGYLLNEIGHKALIKRFKQLMSEDTSRQSESNGSISSSPSSPESTLSPTSSDSGIASPHSHISSQSPQTPNLGIMSPQATSTPGNTNDAAAVRQVLKTPPANSASRKLQSPAHSQSESKSNPLPSPTPGSETASSSSPRLSLLTTNTPSQDGSNTSKQPGKIGSSSQQNVKPQFENVVSETPKTSKSQKLPSQRDHQTPHSNVAGSKSPTYSNPDDQKVQQKKILFPGDPKPASSQQHILHSGLPATGNDKPQSQQVEKLPQQHQQQFQQQHQTRTASVTNSPQIAPTNHNRKEVNPELIKSPIKHKPPDKQHQSPSQPGPRTFKSDTDSNQQQQGDLLPISSDSFGYRTLRSGVVPLADQALGNRVVVLGEESFLKNMPPPNSDDMGPTIHPPSDSLSEPATDEKSLNKRKSLNSKDKDPNNHVISARTSEGTKKNRQVEGAHNLEEQVENLKLDGQTQRNTQEKFENPPTNQTTILSDDLETDAPDEEESISLKEGRQSWISPAVAKPIDLHEGGGSNRSIFANPKDAPLFKAFEPVPASGLSLSPTKHVAVTKPVAAPPGFDLPSSPASQYAPLTTSSSSKQPAKQFSNQGALPPPGISSQVPHQRYQADVLHPQNVTHSSHIFPDHGVSQYGRTVPGLHIDQDQGAFSGYRKKVDDTSAQPNQGSLLPNYLDYPIPGVDTTIPKLHSPPVPTRLEDPTSDTKMSSFYTSTSDGLRYSNQSSQYLPTKSVQPYLTNTSSIADWKAPGYPLKPMHQSSAPAPAPTYQTAPGRMWPDSTQGISRHGGQASLEDGPVVRKKAMSPSNPSYTYPTTYTSSQPVSKSRSAQNPRRVEGKDLGDSALVLPRSAQADNMAYSSSYHQQRSPSSPQGSRSKALEDLKREVANSVAKQTTRSSRKSASKPEYEEVAPEERKTLRRYQEELAGPAKTGDNFIICAPTGSGKTLTAASICLHFHEKAKAEDRPFKALFIVNIRHLTQQQTAAFQETLPVGTVGTIGETDLLKGVFFNPSYSVVMVTAQILVNALKKVPNPDLKLQEISMIIFDECHHTTQDHPYNEVMKRFLKEKKSKLGPRREIGKSGHCLPQIIGLSASLGVGHGKDAFRHVLTLCSNMDAKNVTQVNRHKADLECHVNSPEQDDIIYASSRHDTRRDLSHIISDIMTSIESQLWPQTPAHASQLYEQWVVETRKEAELNSDRNRLVACLYLFDYNRALLLYEDLRAIDAFLHLEKFMANRNVNQALEPIERLCRELFRAESTELKRICHEETDSHNPKLEKLARLLKEKFMNKPHSKGIVLCRMRLATIALVDFIREAQILQDLPYPVKPIRLVGQGEVDNSFMTESQQKAALERFRKDDSYNLLIATDIAQEGLDMPTCNFVIRYNFVSNEIGTVQSKGRARAKQSECFLIVEEGSQNAKRELENRQKVINMQEAMDRLNQLPEAKRLEEITKRQDEIYKGMESKDAMKKITHGIHDSESVQILCKECNAKITTGQYMRKKGCHFTCVDPDIKDRVTVVNYSRPQVYRDTQNVGNFKCGNRTCGQQLGVAIYFLEGQVITHKGFGFKVQSFLFKLPPDGEKRTFKQWKKVTFDIPEM